MSGGKNFSVARVENSPSEVEEVHVETIPKRPIGSPAPEQAATARPEKLVKIAVKKHKSHHGEGSSPATARGKEPVAPTKEDSSPTYRQPKSMKDLCGTRVRKDDEGYYAKIEKLKSKGNPEQLVAAKQWTVDLRANYDKVVTELGEATRCVANYKQSVEFRWGLCRMGQLSYEYGFQVALARFQARYPDLEMDYDPFTEKLEDSLVPMETCQEFDDSVPPKE
ncbi:hypothetical protein B296_00013344 [Ensete ventricosum]|uniref:Uncharacterized protein n=1 Tax=Ensete ventricosum TaxID=4639 RepID=A0A427A5V4_ENSVE|nr:hypothetical protein B296_00013344 [Ensete ventricosum]